MQRVHVVDRGAEFLSIVVLGVGSGELEDALTNHAMQEANSDGTDMAFTAGLHALEGIGAMNQPCEGFDESGPGRKISLNFS
jgi:hypothetical protein